LEISDFISWLTSLFQCHQIFFLFVEVVWICACTFTWLIFLCLGAFILMNHLFIFIHSSFCHTKPILVTHTSVLSHWFLFAGIFILSIFWVTFLALTLLILT
jgi:hypothetical protein